MGSVLGGSWGCWGSSVWVKRLGRQVSSSAQNNGLSRTLRALTQSRWGMELMCQGPEGHMPAPQCPHLKPRLQPPSPTARDGPSRLLHSPAALVLLGAPDQGNPAAACMGRGCLQGGEGCPPLLDRQTGGVGVETWRAGGFWCPTPDTGRGRGRAPPTCQAPSSLLRCLAGPHLPASGAPGPLVSVCWVASRLGGEASWGPAPRRAALGLRPRFLPLAGPFWHGGVHALSLGGGSAEVRNQP